MLQRGVQLNVMKSLKVIVRTCFFQFFLLGGGGESALRSKIGRTVWMQELIIGAERIVTDSKKVHCKLF